MPGVPVRPYFRGSEIDALGTQTAPSCDKARHQGEEHERDWRRQRTQEDAGKPAAYISAQTRSSSSYIHLVRPLSSLTPRLNLSMPTSMYVHFINQ